MAKQRTQLTLCFIHDHPRILLAMKKRGFGTGRWNGYGGKLLEGESIEDAAMREIREESGIVPEALEKRGIVDFEFTKDPDSILEVHVFKITKWSGEPVETEEMRPQWFQVADIPFANMWKDDIYWLPLFLQGLKFKGRFLFDENDNVLEHEILEMQG